jgi:hypothetical protein
MKGNHLMNKKIFKPLNDDQADFLFKLLSVKDDESKFKFKGDNEIPFLSDIVRRRINVMKLPIIFTDLALLAVNCFVDRPGSAVLLLIDALDKYENKVVTVSDLCMLYPDGFYTNEKLIDIIDNELKNKTRKWSEIY